MGFIAVVMLVLEVVVYWLYSVVVFVEVPFQYAVLAGEGMVGEGLLQVGSVGMMRLRPVLRWGTWWWASLPW